MIWLRAHIGRLGSISRPFLLLALASCSPLHAVATPTPLSTCPATARAVTAGVCGSYTRSGLPCVICTGALSCTDGSRGIYCTAQTGCADSACAPLPVH